MSNPFRRLNARFPRKRAFITGAGSGLGLEMARALASDGWTLGLFDRNVERLASVEADLSASGIPLTAYPGDVTHADELTVAVNSCAAVNDGLDVMINNAGVAAAGTLMEVSVEDWRWILEINLMGVVHGSRAAVPHLQRNGSGLIINVGSAAAFASMPRMISYNASKAAVVSLSETLAGELRGSGTQVSVAMPTYFRSSLLESFRGPADTLTQAAGRMEASGYSAAQVAQEILIQAGNGRTYIVLPAQARTYWKIKRWLPGLFLNYLVPWRQKRMAVEQDRIADSG